MARSTEHLPKYQPQDWSCYSPGTTDPTTLTKDELVKVINKAAKAANQRLRSLEKAGQAPASGAYKYAKSQRPQKFPRFKERVKPTDDQMTLRHRYMQLRNFMTMKTSTPILNLPATEAMVKSGRGSWKKSPSLAEAHRHFFGEDFDGAHSAKADAWACARIYFHLTQKHDIGKAP